MTKTAIEFYTERNNGKTPDESMKDGDFISPLFACSLMEEYHNQSQVKLPTNEEIESNGKEGGLKDWELQLFWEGAKWMRDQIKNQLENKE